MSKRAFLTFMGVLAVMALLGFGLLSKGASAIDVGDAAPNGPLERLDGGTGDLAEFHGRWVLVNFWASWCEPCRVEAPALERFWRQRRDRGVVVVGVNLDDASSDARAFVEEFGLTYPQLRDGDGDRWREDYGMTGFPESFLINPEGRLAVIRRGAVDDEVLAEAFAPAIDAGAGEGR